MKWFLIASDYKSISLMFLYEISPRNYGHINYGDIDDEPIMWFDSREEALFIASELKSNIDERSFEPVSEDEMVRRHTPTGLRYRMKSK